MSTVALTELLGTPVFDSAGTQCGRVREVALNPQEDSSRVSNFIVKTKSGNRMLPFAAVGSINGGIYATTPSGEWPKADGAEGLFLLERDLLDQQIIDVHGRKVVRVNDVDLQQETSNNHPQLRVNSVDVGVRGAVRRLLKGVVPMLALRTLLVQLPPKPIPWDFVDLIETDPARRVKLKISHEKLATLHPADIADIIENLGPTERDAVFQTLDEEVAAGALEEVEPKVQKALLESLDSERVADIVEEMNPDAAADLLAELPEEKTEEILEEMGPEGRKEIGELLEFGENTAAGRMNTEFLAVSLNANVADAIESLRHFEGGVESVSTIYLVDSRWTLVGAVPLSKIVLAAATEPLLSLAQEPLIFTTVDGKDKDFVEMFDKYNLVTLPVVDEHQKLVGVITADDIISLLRAKLY